MVDNSSRALPNARVRRVMSAIQDVMGLSGLATILRQAGLQRFTNALPPANSEPGLQASEYAALMQAIENYYGRGARGTLTRIGYAAFERLVADKRLVALGYQLLFRFLPLQTRKLVVLRWLAREISGKPAFMVAMQPTRGLDCGAIEGVHHLLLAQRQAGSAILLVSEELEELLSLSDRVYVIYEGNIMGEVSDGSIEAIGLMMTGTTLEEIQRQTVRSEEP